MYNPFWIWVCEGFWFPLDNILSAEWCIWKRKTKQSVNVVSFNNQEAKIFPQSCKTPSAYPGFPGTVCQSVKHRAASAQHRSMFLIAVPAAWRWPLCPPCPCMSADTWALHIRQGGPEHQEASGKAPVPQLRGQDLQALVWLGSQLSQAPFILQFPALLPRDPMDAATPSGHCVPPSCVPPGHPGASPLPLPARVPT